MIALSLADGLGFLGSAPGYQRTAAGPAQDEANYWIGFFAHQHQIDWNIFTRDSLQTLAYLAVIGVALAVFNLVGPRRAVAQLAVAAISIGAILGCLDALAWLTLAQYWRYDWSQAPQTVIIAAGRDTAAIMNLTSLYTDLSSLTLAIGTLCLGLLARPGSILPSRLRLLAYAVALLSVARVITAEAQLETVGTAITLLSAVLVPALLIWLGLHFDRLARATPVPVSDKEMVELQSR